MTLKKIINTTVSAAALLLIVYLLIVARQCGKGGNKYTQQYVDSVLKRHAISDAVYADSLEFVTGQLELKDNIVQRQTERVTVLEVSFDSLLLRHKITKQKLKPVPQFDNSDTGFVLAPNEYINECEQCFNTFDAYKKENIQLRFERDSYDTLMRLQAGISQRRVTELEGEKMIFNKMYNDCISAKASVQNTRKLKISAMGMANDLFIPKGGGPGLIYEDKKFNEYGAHVVFTTAGKMYFIHIAKTISLRRKK